MINELIKAVTEDIQGDDSCQLPVSPETDITRIPTLQKGSYETMSPMLLDRYKKFGAWSNASHGDWLSLEDMEILWQDWDNNGSNRTYAKSLIEAAENWENDAIRLFRPERISIFAASHDTYERIYLLWFDGSEEPEFWVYDTNGASRYKDLSAYLRAYLDDDLSSYSTHWILGYSQ